MSDVKKVEEQQIRIELTKDDYAQQCWILSQENMMLRKHIKTLSEQEKEKKPIKK